MVDCSTFLGGNNRVARARILLSTSPKIGFIMNMVPVVLGIFIIHGMERSIPERASIPARGLTSTEKWTSHST